MSVPLKTKKEGGEMWEIQIKVCKLREVNKFDQPHWCSSTNVGTAVVSGAGIKLWMGITYLCIQTKSRKKSSAWKEKANKLSKYSCLCT